MKFEEVGAQKKRRVQAMMNGAKGGTEKPTRENAIRKIAETAVLHQGAVERFIEALRRAGFLVVPEEPTSEMMQAAAGLVPKHMLKSANKVGAL